MVLGGFVASCASPDALTPADCGNGVVEAGEDCEPFAGQVGTCAAPGEANACHFTCAASDACPPSYGCSSDGVCRQSTGAFAEAKSSPFAGEFEATSVADFNGDGVPDVLTAANFDGARIAYGSPAHDGTFPTGTAFAVAYNGQLGVGDFDGDGIADLGIDTEQGIAIMRGATDGTLVSQTSPSFAPPAGSFSNGDLEVPMHPDPTSPFHEMLHVSFFNDHTTLSFDQPNNLFTTLAADPNPITFSGHKFLFTGTGPVNFPVADLDPRPSIGGDEIVVGFFGETVVHVLTAKPVNGIGTGLPATLTAAVDIAGWPGTLQSPVQIADIDGDGRLDLAALVVLPDTTTHVAVALNHGSGAWGVPAVDPEFDQFLNIAGTFANDFNGDFLLANLAGDARADVVAFEGSQIFTRTDSGFQLAGKVPNACVHPALCETVTPDLNRDGIRDVVMNSTTGLAIDYGGSDGVFDQAFVLTPGAPINLRVGDYDGDRVDDVMFVIQDGSADSTMYILYGTTTGVPAAPTKIASWPALQYAEPVLLGPDQTANPEFFTTEDSITDIVVVANPLQATLLLGNAGRTMLSNFGLTLETPAVLGGRFTGSAATDELLTPFQRPTPALHELEVFDFPLDGNYPGDRRVDVDALGVESRFDANACTVYTHGDVDGDGIDEVIALQACDPQRSLGGIGPAAQELLVTPTTGTKSTVAAIQTGLPQEFIKSLHVADVDGDGHLDVLAVFAGDSASCIAKDGSTTDPCEAKNSGVVVMFGDGAGGFATTAVLPSAGAGEPFDVVALNVDADPELELAVVYQQGVYVFDQGARAFTPAAAPILPLSSFEATIAAADLDGNGTTDLVVNDNGSVHVLVAAPVVH
nr:VCBS repeat-containing protein [Kofleriaceae bacterium]